MNTTARNFDRPEYYLYKFETFLHCDARCGAVEVLVSRDYDTDEARAERERTVTAQARAKGWSVEGGHCCPACGIAAQFTDDARRVIAIVDEPARIAAACELNERVTAAVGLGPAVEMLASALDVAGVPRFADGTAPGTERLHGDRCMCAGAGCRERPAR